MKVLLIVLVAAAGVAALTLAAFFFFFFKGPDLRPYLSLKQPRIVSKDDELVLQVAFAGNSVSAIQEAFGVLFKSYYRIKGAPKGPAMKAPRGRYVLPAEMPKDPAARLEAVQARGWSGAVAIPVPAGTEAPQAAPGSGPRAEIAAWKYGEVAEVLHLGPYDTEPATVELLERFVESQGYELAGEHEEEYLKGPGMPLVRPKDYWTIIRYQVRKKAAP